ncbi:MAG: hypothetical protein QG637_1523 [Chloroflexota bacterium]|nr:hypothetical protein [Chloroflexota bacterium]
MKQPWRVFGIVSLTMMICLAATLGLRAPAAQAQGACSELAQNGGFENNAAWLLGPAPQKPEYVTYARHGGNRSLVLGITKGASQESYSSARQTVTIPLSANTVTLSFWFNAMMTDPLRGQFMELALLASNGTVLDKPWHSQNDSRTWNQMSFDLSRWRGRTVQIYFNVYNDGQGGTAGMFLDDVSLVACSNGTPAATATSTPAATATSTATPTATTTPPPTQTPTAGGPTWTMTAVPPTATATLAPTTPTATAPPSVTPAATKTPSPVATVLPYPVTPGPGGCVDLAKNGGFEYGLSGWYPSANVLPVRIVASPALSPPNALQLGTQSQQAKSYSSVRQYLVLPPGTRVTLQFSTWTWSESNAGADRQEAILLASNNSVLTVLWRVLANEQGWRQIAVDLTPYSGRAVAIYFNAVNDGAGGRTALFLDNVQVLACGWSSPPPVPVTVLPLLTISPPETLAEIADTTSLGPAAAGINPAPVMTRVALEGPPGATPSPRATATATLMPSPTPTPKPPPLGDLWDVLTKQFTLPACLTGSLIILVIIGLFIWWRRG